MSKSKPSHTENIN